MSQAVRNLSDKRPQIVLHDDEIFAAHVGGKLSVALNAPLDTQRALSVAYTPGVAQVSRAIAADHTLAARYTWANRMVAVVSDGSAVLGLGDIGPAASLPVMEGKSALFKAFADLDSIPIVLDTKDPDEIVETLMRLRPTFGAVNLEDISAPRCFEIERRLIEALDCPVMHDDQHGTAIVVLAALSAPRRSSTATSPRCGWSSPVPAPPASPAQRSCWPGESAISRCWTPRASCIRTAATSTRTRPRSPSRPIRTACRAEWPRRSRAPTCSSGCPPASCPPELVATMAPDAIVFALSNPDPEIHPDDAKQVRGRGGHRPQRLPEPDQQRARVPGCVPGCAGRRRPPHHREDEGGGGRGDLLGGGRRSRGRPHRARACWTRGSAPAVAQAVAAASERLGSAGAPARLRARRSGDGERGRLRRRRRAPSMAVGSAQDPESALIAHLYAAALRFYGSPPMSSSRQIR